MTANEPIALIGIGCRFPGGANSPSAFWDLLIRGVDAVGELPRDRCNPDLWFADDASVPGRTYTRAAACLSELDQFDADFFGIAPREAVQLDPQHRLLLQTAWEALEDAGVPPHALAGSDTGVFVGIYSEEYAVSGVFDPTTINSYSNTGGAASIGSGRLSHFFDLHGPSMSVNTACSSSLVALSLACESLWNKETSLALVGGVNLLLSPELFVGFCKASMLSRRGRCMTFDARADGFVRGEGAGVVVLKPLARARADGDRVYAVIRAVGVNQDGKTPGIAFPNQSAQAALLRALLSQAQVSPAQIQYVEAHGTGTPVGDPIECTALGEVLGSHRQKTGPCRIGSVKTNIGHLEGGAGIAGLIKLALMLHHRTLPPHLHFEQPHPDIDFAGLNLQVQTRLEHWPRGTGPRLGAVSSFGFGGTNAQALLEESDSPPTPVPEAGPPRTELLLLSAQSPAALRAEAEAYEKVLAAEPPLAMPDVCYTAGVRRSHLEYRLAVTATSTDELVERLQAFRASGRHTALSSGRSWPDRKPRVAFVFCGNGPQWWAMGRQLMTQESVFRDAVERCAEALRPLADWSLMDEFASDETQSRMDHTDVAQPALFALQMGLVELWRSWGVEPEVVLGHSVGEIAAAWCAGALTLAEAAAVVHHRSRTQETTRGRGRMAAVGVSVAEAERLLLPYAGRLGLAAVNSTTSVTFSGDGTALDELAKELQARQVFYRPLRLEYAFHSPSMDSLREELLASLDGLAPQGQPRCRFVSTVTAADCVPGQLDANYWWANLREPVQFGPAVQRLIDDGIDVFVEIGPHPVLIPYVTELLAGSGHTTATVLGSLRRQDDERATVLGALGKLHTLGVPICWQEVIRSGKFIDLPTYPWQNRRYWTDRPIPRVSLGRDPVHPLLGSRVELAQDCWESELDLRVRKYLADHRLAQSHVFPLTGYLEIALAAAEQLFGPAPWELLGLDVHKPLSLPDTQPVQLQTLVSPVDRTLRIWSWNRKSDHAWQLHVSARIGKLASARPPDAVDLKQLLLDLPEVTLGEDYYRHYYPDFGPLFKCLDWIRAGEERTLAMGTLAPALNPERSVYHLHPSLLDACLQVGVPLIDRIFGSRENRNLLYVPVCIDRLRFYGAGKGPIYAVGKHLRPGANGAVVDVTAYDESGAIVAEFEGIHAQVVDMSGRTVDENLLFGMEWVAKPRDSDEAEIRDANFLPGPSALAASLQDTAASLYQEHQRRRYYEHFVPRSNQVVAAYLRQALEQLRPGPATATLPDLEALLGKGGAQPQFRSLLKRALHFLQIENSNSPAASAGPDEMWRALVQEFPAYHAELMLVRKCGEHLTSVLRGETPAMDMIFGEKGLATAEHLYDSGPTFRTHYALLQRAVSAMLAAMPRGRKLRILEIGASTGGATGWLLRHLLAEQTQYVFTDVSDYFLGRAQERFRGHPFVEYRLLDIERDPLTQGFTPHDFDIIVAANVLHATRDLAETLTHVRWLLASEGALALVQLGPAAPRWLDIVFGLLPDMWRFADHDRRPDNALMSSPAWRALLHKGGFQDVISITDCPLPEAADQWLYLARGPIVRSAPTHVPSLSVVSSADDTARPAQDVAIVPLVPTDWLVLADQVGLGLALADRLRDRGATVTLAQPGTDVLARLPASAALGVVFLCGVDVKGPDDFAAIQAACLGALQIAQEIEQLPATTRRRLWLITAGGETLLGDAAALNPGQAALWGLGRVIHNELPNLQCTLVDIGSEAASRSGWNLDGLIDELHNREGEPEVLLRGPERFVHRLRPKALEGSRALVPDTLDHPPIAYRLEIPARKGLDQLRLRQVPYPQPHADQVVIEVRATGLNFRDVLLATGVLSVDVYESGAEHTGLGLECAGIVHAVGASVTDLKVGDEVIAFAPHAFSRFVVIAGHQAVAKPANMTFEEAATVLSVFLTAYYGLQHQARLQPGERVLIHGAAGGVGLAAIQIVKHLGGEVLATAGSPEKRGYLQGIGVRHVFDSRSLAFVDDVRGATGGDGVDVILNSVAGETMERSLGLLRPFGRFLEIGKRDYLENRPLGLRPFLNNLAYFSIDADQLLVRKPELGGAILKELLNLFERGVLHPLPYRVFPIADVGAAFGFMQRSQHIGKVVVDLRPEPSLSLLPSVRPTFRFRSDGTYLITGGLTGFGLATASLLAEWGAGYLVLAGRRGQHTPNAAEGIAQLERFGTQVQAVAVDVTDATALENLLDEIRRELPPLRGVVHAAMVLDDASVLNLDAERLRRVLEPKVLGAWNLHRLTQGDPLECFLLFSSFASVIGNPGQANYAAANAFLDALARWRVAQGRPALALNWGAIAEVGHVARHLELAARFARSGTRLLTPAQATRTLGRLLMHGEFSQVSIIDFEWDKLGAIPHYVHSPVWSHLVRRPTDAGVVDQSSASFQELLQNTPKRQRPELLQRRLAEHVARVLGTTLDRLDSEKGLTLLGLDSLMAVELRIRIERDMDLDVPLMALMQGPSVIELARQLSEQMSPSSA